MGKLRFLLALWLAKLSIPALKITRHNGTDFPGNLAVKLCPDFLRYVGKPKTIVTVTGTNGKTTTSNMIGDILESSGRRILSNRAGSNMLSGVATALLQHCDLLGRMKDCDAAVLEIDERSSPFIYRHLTPDLLVVTNLYRDSIKRNGHSAFIFDKIAQSLPAETVLLLNGNDAISGALGEGTNRRLFFSVDRTARSTDTCPNTACDITACPRCGHMLTFDYFHFHHIGAPHCQRCGFAMPESSYTAREVDFAAETFTLHRKDGADLRLPFPTGDLFNVFNVTAAAAACLYLGVSGEDAAQAISRLTARTGRFEAAHAGELDIVTMLSKNQNPISSSQSLAYLGHVAGHKDVVLLLTDSKDAVHGHEDISWLYDTDFDVLKDASVGKVFLGGTRCYDLALRLMLAGVPEEKLRLFPDYGELEKALPREIEGRGTAAIFFELYAMPIAQRLRQALEAHFGNGKEAANA